MNPAEEILNKLKAILGGNAEETLAAAQDLEARAQVAGLATKALDEGEWSIHQAKVKELETKLAEVTTLASTQADTILALDSRLKAMEAAQAAQATAQAAYQSRGEKAINEVKGLLVTLNAKPELTAPAEQAKLQAAEEATKAKLEAAEGAGKAGGVLTLKRFDYAADGRPVVKPI